MAKKKNRRSQVKELNELSTIADVLRTMYGGDEKVAVLSEMQKASMAEALEQRLQQEQIPPATALTRTWSLSELVGRLLSALTVWRRTLSGPQIAGVLPVVFGVALGWVLFQQQSALDRLENDFASELSQVALLRNEVAVLKQDVSSRRSPSPGLGPANHGPCLDETSDGSSGAARGDARIRGIADVSLAAMLSGQVDAAHSAVLRRLLTPRGRVDDDSPSLQLKLVSTDTLSRLDAYAGSTLVEGE